MTTHIIFDLNGTLADTKRAFLATRRRFVTRLSKVTGVNRAQLYSEVRAFLRNGSLQPDIAEHLMSVNAWKNWPRGAGDRRERSSTLDREIERFRQHIEQSYRLKANTRQALAILKQRNIALSIWSESRAPYVADMMILLKLDGLIDRVFCPAQLEGVSTSLDEKLLHQTRLNTLEATAKKPSSQTLRAIVKAAGATERSTLLVGNSIVGDGLSTVGTKVRFVLVKHAALSETEMALADVITGMERQRLDEQQEHYATLRRHVTPLYEIQNLADLLDRL